MSWLQEEWGFTEEDMQRLQDQWGLNAPFVAEGGWQTESDKVADHYRKEKEKGLVMELAAHFGLKVVFTEGAEGDHTQPPTKAS